MKILIASVTLAFIIYMVIIIVFNKKNNKYAKYLEELENDAKDELNMLNHKIAEANDKYKDDTNRYSKKILQLREQIEHLEYKSENVDRYIEEREVKLERMKEDYINPLDVPKYIQLFMEYDRELFQKNYEKIYGSILSWVFAEKLIPNKLDPFTQKILHALPKTILEYTDNLENIAAGIDYYDILVLRNLHQKKGQEVLSAFIEQFELDTDFRKVIEVHLVEDFEKTFQALKDLIYLVRTYKPERIMTIYVAHEKELKYLKPLIDPHVKPIDRVTYVIEKSILGGMLLEDQYFKIDITHLTHLNEIMEAKE